MRLHYSLSISLAAFILAITAFFTYRHFSAVEQSEADLDISSPLNQDYDSFMTDVDRLYYTPEGKLDYRILGDRFSHYENADITRIEAPNFIIYQQNENPWLISAEKGVLTKDIDLDQDRIELIDNVLIQHIDNAGKPVDIYTEFLTIFPQTSFVSTEFEVEIITTGGQVLGLGMTADLEENIINLLANVRGRYENALNN